MISLNKCTESNVSSPKIFVPKEAKDINVKAFNMITNKSEAFHVIVNENSIVRHVIQIKNGIIKHVNMNAKIIISAKKIVVGIVAHAVVRIANI